MGNVNHNSNSFNYKCTLDIKLHGNLDLFILRIVLLSCLFILTISVINLATFLMLLNLNIANMIKGKQHFKTIRFINTVCKSILLVLIANVMIENTSVIKDLNKIKETEEYLVCIR